MTARWIKKYGIGKSKKWARRRGKAYERELRRVLGPMLESGDFVVGTFGHVGVVVDRVRYGEAKR